MDVSEGRRNRRDAGDHAGYRQCREYQSRQAHFEPAGNAEHRQSHKRGFLLGIRPEICGMKRPNKPGSAMPSFTINGSARTGTTQAAT